MAGATAVVVTAVMMELEVVRVEEKDRSLFAHMAGAVVLVAAPCVQHANWRMQSNGGSITKTHQVDGGSLRRAAFL